MLKREKVHDKGSGARPDMRLGRASLCSYFALVGPQNSGSGAGLHACTVLPLCWLIPPTYKTHKIEKNECKCQEICPCSQQPKKELVYATYERAVTHSFSDGMIPLGSLLLANIEHIFLQFIFPVWFIPHIHLEKHAQHHHNSCTAKSITTLIDHGFVSCPNTDNKELDMRCTQILSLSFTVSGNDKTDPSRTMKPIQKSPKCQPG